MRIIKEGQMPKGAVRVHFDKIENAMAPRGSMEKESLGAYILERLESNLEHWMDPKYADCVGEWEGVKTLVAGARAEFEAAIEAFLARDSD